MPLLHFKSYSGIYYLDNVQLNKNLLRNINTRIIIISTNETKLLREQKSRFGKVTTDRGEIHDQLKRVCEISEHLHYHENTILLCHVLHTLHPSVRKIHSKNFLIWYTIDALHRVGALTVIYVDVISVPIVLLL